MCNVPDNCGVAVSLTSVTPRGSAFSLIRFLMASCRCLLSPCFDLRLSAASHRIKILMLRRLRCKGLRQCRHFVRIFVCSSAWPGFSFSEAASVPVPLSSASLLHCFCASASLLLPSAAVLTQPPHTVVHLPPSSTLFLP